MNKIEQLQHEFKLFSKDLLLPTTTLDSYRKSQGFTCEYINPTVIEERKLNVTQIDVFSRLMMDRIIFLGTAIDDTVGNIITAQLLFMQSQNPDETIQLYINSPGGSVSDGLTIYDTMNFIKPNVNTLVTGTAASMGFILSINGAHRMALKHARLMQHQPSGGLRGTSVDIEIQAQEMKKIKNELYNIIVEKTGQSFEKVQKDCDNGDYWMNGEEAIVYGALDEIMK